ncbi:MAG: hypothetical protein JXA73_05225 [Acidobacteria bacterium]|nr:hypothetical protein [Acidobacteriota bacterium]
MSKKKLFSKDVASRGTVILNWHGSPWEEFIFYAQSYHLVAKEAVESLKRDTHMGLYTSPMNDFRAYPIVFLYRHALELYLKAVILIAAPMLKLKDMETIDNDRLLSTHSLDILRQNLERIFNVYEWEWDLGTPHFRTQEDFRKFIDELVQVDKKSVAFRYPLDTKGNASLKPHFTFNLFDFCAIFDGLLESLEGAACAAHEDLQLEYEILSEFQ